MKNKRVLSLFSGAGGIDLGFEGGFKVVSSSINEKLCPDWIEYKEDNWIMLKKTGFKTIFANDISADAALAWTSYFKRDVFELADISDVLDKVNNHQMELPNNVDIVTGGFPCQDFSHAGKRQGFNTERGLLYKKMLEVVKLVRPSMFLAENVKGLTDLGDAQDVIYSDFSKEGYLVLHPRVLHAADYGVAQSRERVFFIGFRTDRLTDEAMSALTQPLISDEYDPYPKPTHSFSVCDEDLAVPVSCRKALAGLPEPEFSSDLSQKKYSKAKYMGSHCQGQTEIKLDSIGPTIRSEHHGNIEFRRLSIEHGGINTDELSEGLNERRLTVRECARLQTFPDEYEFVTQKKGSSISASSAYKLIGNAVPCLLAYNFAMKIQKNWDRYFNDYNK